MSDTYVSNMVRGGYARMKLDDTQFTPYICLRHMCECLTHMCRTLFVVDLPL